MAYQAIDRGRIGARIRAHREMQKRSLRYVGDRLGVSHQQIMKYESGASGISSERLAALAAILNTSVAVLVGEGRANDNEKTLDENEARLLNGFAKIKNPESRMLVVKLVEIVEKK